MEKQFLRQSEIHASLAEHEIKDIKYKLILSLPDVCRKYGIDKGENSLFCKFVSAAKEITIDPIVDKNRFVRFWVNGNCYEFQISAKRRQLVKRKGVVRLIQVY